MAPPSSPPLSQDFKLCGFLPLVVSVLPSSNPEPLLSPETLLPSLDETPPKRSASVNYDFPFEGVCYSRRRPDAPHCFSNSGCAESAALERIQRLIGAECWLTGEGAEAQFHTNGGFVLTSIVSVAQPRNANCACMSRRIEKGIADSKSEICECFCDRLNKDKGNCSSSSHGNVEFERTPTPGRNIDIEAVTESLQRRTSSKKRKRTGSADGRDQILNNLQVLTVRNGVRVKGHVVRVARRAAEVRAVVLLDLYLPSFLWSGRNYWKRSPAFTAILNHVSCDWESRRKHLEYEGRKLENQDCDDIWHLGDCRVLGCGMHYEISEATKRLKFNMYNIFKSLPSLVKDEEAVGTAVVPEKGKGHSSPGMWDVPNEVLTSIFSRLSPRDLQSVAATCKYTRERVSYIMPCINLKLFPHQQAAVCWMLERELHPKTFRHPLFKDLLTEDGFHFYLNCLTGDLSPETPPCITDLRGGLFCDEPGLGKTVTALSLILKTQGTLATPPAGTHINWCEHRSGDRYGYYEVSFHRVASMMKRCMELKAKRNRFTDMLPSSQPSSQHPMSETQSLSGLKREREPPGTTMSNSFDTGPATRASNAVKRRLLEAYEGSNVIESPTASANKGLTSRIAEDGGSELKNSNKGNLSSQHDVWVQCDSCTKWRKMEEGSKPPEEGIAWFCNMNKDTLHQSCSDPEESWESGLISSLPGFYKVGGASGLEQNVIHFANVLKDSASLRGTETNAALKWLAKLSSEKLMAMAGAGISVPQEIHLFNLSSDDQHKYDIIFQRFGLVPRREGKGLKKWCYPKFLDGLVFDLPAFREALNRPMDVVRLYLSRATLIVVPSNLVEHWKNQISRHTKPGQLRVCVWNEQKKPPKVQDLAWNFDIVITTFSRLSCEWSYKENSVLMSVHWLRIMLDEGHTLGASLSLTNKLQMAMSMHASRRWVLTGTPTPHTPNSQVTHLHPMLKFLHEEVYGGSQKSWEDGILKPFEAGCEEGHVRLLDLLQRCMISARKSDLCTIPPCVRKITLLDFTQKHAESYNELVETVRRNILMADWNDPSHVESLLNPKQWKFRSTTIRNVRLSCCVAGHIKVENAGEDIQETMEIFAQQGMDPLSWEFAVIKNALLVGGDCNRCNEWCRLPIVTPCKHLLCLHCAALDRERCTLPGCGNPYKMQSPEDLTRPENPNPKWPVPQDLIELQPSYVQDNWDPDWQATASSKVAYLVERLKSIRCMDTLERELDCAEVYQHETSRDSPNKAIVFSQFLEHIHVIERQLAKAGIKVAGMYSPMHSANKMKSLLNFQNDRDCMVLLMDGSAALGLDLSFVTHVYLMEPIWDRSMEEQVVSRAHRMGATRPILVETLAMRGTIEEQMIQFLQDPVEYSRAVHEEAHILDSGRSSLRTVHDFAESSYLARLSFVRTKTGT